MYLPPDDRRHYVAWSEAVMSDFDKAYWDTLFGFYDAGGRENIAAFLAGYDLSQFDAKAAPPKTAAFWQLVEANEAPEQAGLADTIERVLKHIQAFTLSDLIYHSSDDETLAWLEDRKNRRTFPHRIESAGFTRVRNDTSDDGLWRIDGKRQTIYAKKELSERERIIAAQQRLKHVRPTSTWPPTRGQDREPPLRPVRKAGVDD